jgi:uncharacterized protein HemX
MIIVLGILTAAGTAFIEGGDVIQVVIILVLALVGLGILPVRGWLLEQAYANRMKDLKARYTEILSRAAKEQINYGTQLRQDVTAPFTRLIKTQTEQVDELKRELQLHEQDIIGLQHSMSALLKG